MVRGLSTRRRFLAYGSAASGLSIAGCINSLGKTGMSQSKPRGWPMYGYDPANTSYKPANLKMDSNGEVVWETTSVNSNTGPVSDSKRVYTGDEKIVALSQEDGSRDWIFKLDAHLPHSPLIFGDSLFFGTTNGNTYALDTEKGERSWKTNVNGRIGVSAPNIAGENVYFSTFGMDSSSNTYESDDHPENEEGSVIAIGQEDGSIQWEFDLHDTSVESPVASDGNAIYLVSKAGDAYALRAESGRKKWEITRPSEDTRITPPIVSNKTVYFGRATAETPEIQIYAVDSSNGEFKWTKTLGERKSPGFAVKGDKIYTVGQAFQLSTLTTDSGGSEKPPHRIYAIDRETGSIEWEKNVMGKRPAKPVIGSRYLYTGFGGTIKAISPKTGSVNWSIKFWDTDVASQIALVNDGLLVRNGNKLALVR